MSRFVVEQYYEFDIYIVLALSNNSPQVDIFLHFQDNYSLVLLIKSVCSVEKHHIPIL